jgi:cytochrome c-type biogenesis protein CcmH/NrfG
VVSGGDWTLEEALALPAVPGCALVAWGFADLGERFSWHLHAADREAKKLLWEGTFERERGGLGSLLSAAAAALDAALGAPAAIAAQGADRWDRLLPTKHEGALSELLLAMDVREAIGFGIRIPNPNETFEPFLRALELDPACELAMSLLADAAYRWVSDAHGPADTALAALARARDLLPKDPRPLSALAECELRAGRARDALATAERLRALLPRMGNEPARAEELLGRIQVELGDATEAASAFRRAVRLDPRRSLSWQHLGHLAAQLGKWDEAEICYVQASQLEPGRADLKEAVKRIRGELIKIREQRGPLRPPDAKNPLA